LIEDFCVDRSVSCVIALRVPQRDQIAMLLHFIQDSIIMIAPISWTICNGSVPEFIGSKGSTTRTRMPSVPAASKASRSAPQAAEQSFEFLHRQALCCSAETEPSSRPVNPFVGLLEQ
jgi:hypothetical protein